MQHFDTCTMTFEYHGGHLAHTEVKSDVLRYRSPRSGSMTTTVPE